MEYNKDLFIAKRDDCASLCSQKKECHSFEHCMSPSNCGIIDLDMPMSEDNCIKVHGEKVCSNFCILNTATKPIQFGNSEYKGKYDFCKQEGECSNIIKPICH